MVEKRQTRSGDNADTAGDPGSDAQVAALKSLPDGVERLPDGAGDLPSGRDDFASALLELAERQVAEARRKLGPQASKPKLKRVEDLFAAKAGRAPQVAEDLKQLMRSPALVPQTAKLDGTFDVAIAQSFNAYDKSSVAAGASVQTAYDNWNLAVRVYESSGRSAGAILEAAIESAKLAVNSDTSSRGAAQVNYYTKSSSVGVALLAYEKSMQQACSDLGTAFGQLITGLYNAVGALAVAEATLISTRETTHKTFWTGMQSAIGQART